MAVSLTNVTENFGVLGVAGPNAGELMERVAGDESKDWGFMRARTINIGGADCLAIRISYTGELGWEIYPEMKDMETVYKVEKTSI